MTRLSVYRENASNRWETDLIMFSFFSNFHSLEGLFSVSLDLKPQRYISLHSHTFPFFPPVGRGRARPPRLSVTFRVFPKNACVCLCAETKSAVVPLQVWSGEIRKTDDGLFQLFKDRD